MKIIPEKYSCPKCLGSDHYFAKRTVGQMGVAMDFSNTSVNPGMLRGVEADVALCRECGERMNYTPQQKIAETEKEKQSENAKVVFGVIALIATVVMWIYIIWG